MKRILYLSYTNPFLPFSGYTYRTTAVLRWLLDRYHVDVLYEGASPGELERRYVPMDRFGRIEAVTPARGVFRQFKAVTGGLPHHHCLHCSREMGSAVRAMLETGKYDLIWANKSVHLPLLEGQAGLPPVVLDQIAAEPEVWDNLIRSDPRWYLRLYSRYNRRRVLAYERSVYSRLAGVIPISPTDVEVTRVHYPPVPHLCIPQGIDAGYYQPAAGAQPDPDVLLFSGTAAVRNVEAMRRMVERIMPILHRRAPQLRLLWIGNVVRGDYGFLKHSWIETTGFVEDTPPYFDRGVIYVAPFDMGEGMKTKIVEALAMGKPTVATSAGLCGVESAGSPFLRQAESDVEFAEEVLALRARPRFDDLAQAARRHAVENYAWDRVLAPLEPFLEQCIASPARL